VRLVVLRNLEMTERKKKPQLVVLSSPSGGGKTTICRALVAQNDKFRISLSATTREPRPDEKEGIHYYFISEDEFKNRIQQQDFLEYQVVHGNYYGTLKKQVETLLQAGYSVIFDIDVYGAIKIKEQYPEAILIFIRPPSLEELKHRLKMRKSDSEDEIRKRLQRLPEEYAKAAYFDYDITNDDLNKTLNEIVKIIHEKQTERHHVPKSPL
jgi:guanylate kinase